MPVIHVRSEAEFKTMVMKAADRLVVVDFTAEWCGPCKRIGPIFDQLSDKYRQAVFLKVDVDECQELALGNGVAAMPTFLFLKAGSELDRIQGADPESLENKVKELAGSSGPPTFSGEGQRLGGLKLVGCGLTSQPAVLDQESLTDLQTTAQAQIQVDETRPTTKVNVRLANGNKLTVRLNLSHPVSSIREFICSVVPDQSYRLFGLMTTHPKKEITEESLTIEQADLANSVIVQVMKD